MTDLCHAHCRIPQNGGPMPHPLQDSSKWRTYATPTAEFFKMADLCHAHCRIPQNGGPMPRLLRGFARWQLPHIVRI
ncbi:hypothetical protein M0802_015842 [Mischocyttarus mexicanus]|nr:hypothetical protein M0802_015842 [Mischocyttarus mexicanus]